MTSGVEVAVRNDIIDEPLFARIILPQAIGIGFNLDQIAGHFLRFARSSSPPFMRFRDRTALAHDFLPVTAARQYGRPGSVGLSANSGPTALSRSHIRRSDACGLYRTRRHRQKGPPARGR